RSRSPKVPSSFAEQRGDPKKGTGYFSGKGDRLHFRALVGSLHRPRGCLEFHVAPWPGACCTFSIGGTGGLPCSAIPPTIRPSSSCSARPRPGGGWTSSRSRS